MPGDYSNEEILAMDPTQLYDAAQRGFAKPQDPADVSARPAVAGINLGTSVPQTPQPSENVWKRRVVGDDFITPSGQKCRLRSLQVEQLLMEGILDQVTRLDGLAQQLVTMSQGLPPEGDAGTPSREDFSALLDLVNKVTLMAVVEPPVYADSATGTLPDNAVMVSDIDLGDRIAILNESLKHVKALDNFRDA